MYGTKFCSTSIKLGEKICLCLTIVVLFPIEGTKKHEWKYDESQGHIYEQIQRYKTKI